MREGGNEINGGSDVGEDKRGGDRGRCKDGVVIDRGIQRWMWKKEREGRAVRETKRRCRGAGWMDGEGWRAGGMDSWVSSLNSNL